MTFKRIMSMLLVLSMLAGILATVSFAVDTSTLHNCNVPDGYHLFTNLPTVDAPETTETLYLGAALVSGETTTFYALNSTSTKSSSSNERTFTTSSTVSEQCTITVKYGGVDETYGTYYYVIFTLPSGTSYAFSYDSGYWSNNMIQDNGMPSDGWAAKNKFFYNAEQNFFLHRPAADMTVTKGLTISTSSHKLFTKNASDMLGSSAYPVRLYGVCTSNNTPGYDDNGHWSGTCSCGYKFGYAAHDTVNDWNVKDAEGHGKKCSCGYDIVAKTGHDLPTEWSIDNTGATPVEYKICTTCSQRVEKDHQHSYGTEWEKDATGHWHICSCNGKDQVLDHDYGAWTEDTAPSLSAPGEEKRTCGDCGWEDTRPIDQLTADDFKVVTTKPEENVPYYWGSTQLDKDGDPIYYFKGAMTGKNLDTTSSIANGTVMYVEKVTDGYRLYFMDGTAKKYICMGRETSTWVDIKEVDAAEATVFAWNDEFDTFEFTLNNSNFYLGTYTADAGAGTAYSKLNPLPQSYLAGDQKDHTFVVKLFALHLDHDTETAYDETNHYDLCFCGEKLNTAPHSYGDWIEDTPATETASGTKHKECACGHKVEDTIPATHDHVYGTEWKKDATGHWHECSCGDKKDTAQHSFGNWEVVKAPTTLADKGSNKRTCSACGYVETVETTLDKEDIVEVTDAPKPGVPYYMGATQLQVENTPTYYFKGVWAPTKYQNMDVSTDIAKGTPVYVEEVTGGYKLYFEIDEGVKTYFVIDSMEVSGTTSVYVQPVDDASKASVFTWNDEYDTLQTYVAAKDAYYYIGHYTEWQKDNPSEVKTAYTKLQALLVTGLGRTDRHPAKLYAGVYKEPIPEDHVHSFGTEWSSDKENHFHACACGEKKDTAAHTFGGWSVVTAPTTLQDKGSDKRTCSECGYEETRVTSLTKDDYTVATSAPKAGTPFYLGATQLQVEKTPTYYFKGTWAPSKYQMMDVSTDMNKATAMYAEAVSGGYKLYFMADGVKTYLVVDNMEVSGDTKVFIQPVTDAAKASVFVWNDEYDTFVTTVADKGEYYIGNYTYNETNYTKLSALMATGLGRNDRHAGKIYVVKSVNESNPNTGDSSELMGAFAVLVMCMTAGVILIVGKKKLI